MSNKHKHRNQNAEQVSAPVTNNEPANVQAETVPNPTPAPAAVEAKKDPSTLTLVCPVTGKTIVWTNKTIINAKIAEAGGLDNFRKNYISREGKRLLKAKSIQTQVTTAPVMKEILEQGAKIADAVPAEGVSTQTETVPVAEETVAVAS